MFKVRVYFGAVTGGQNGISGSPRGAGNYVFRTLSITFTENMYPPTLLGVFGQDLLLEQSERGPPSAPALRAVRKTVFPPRRRPKSALFTGK